MALGEALGPLLAVFISSHLTPHSMFMVSAIIGIAVALMTVIILRGKKRTDAVINRAQSSELVPEIVDSRPELIALVRSDHN